MSISPVEIGAAIAAGLLSASKLISSIKVLWDKLPRWVAVLMPVLVLSLPQLAAAAGLIKVDTDLVTFAMLAVGLLLPGFAEAEKVPVPAPVVTVK